MVARELLSALAQAETASRSEAMALSWMDDEVDPRIRFCAYKLGRKDAHDVAGIVAEFQGAELDELLDEYAAKSILSALRSTASGQEASGIKKSMGEVEWLGQRIAFRNADVVTVMERVGKATARLEQLTQPAAGDKKAKGGKMKAYDRVLLELSEGIEKVKRIREEAEVSLDLFGLLFTSLECKDSYLVLTIVFTSVIALSPSPTLFVFLSLLFLLTQSSASTTASTSSQPDSLSILQDYLIHSLLTHRISRDLLLIKTQLRPFTLAATVTSRASVQAASGAAGRALGGPAIGSSSSSSEEAEMRALPIVIKLFDGVIKAWEAIRDLGAIERDGEVSEAVEAKIGYFRAKRFVKIPGLEFLSYI